MTPQKAWLTIKEIIQEYGRSQHYWRTLIKDGVLRIQPGGGLTLVERASIESYVRGEAPSPPPAPSAPATTGKSTAELGKMQEQAEIDQLALAGSKRKLEKAKIDAELADRRSAHELLEHKWASMAEFDEHDKELEDRRKVNEDNRQRVAAAGVEVSNRESAVEAAETRLAAKTAELKRVIQHDYEELRNCHLDLKDRDYEYRPQRAFPVLWLPQGLYFGNAPLADVVDAEVANLDGGGGFDDEDEEDEGSEAG
ncbi:hypothetical protein LCGC14_2220490 [marine sediment metagenome]|uniref:Uncharacterized protein n=1 Tax=marine sediment metagenome TaxID=412755 RepID=A0A0F9DB90_9ZZZZ